MEKSVAIPFVPSKNNLHRVNRHTRKSRRLPDFGVGEGKGTQYSKVKEGKEKQVNPVIKLNQILP